MKTVRLALGEELIALVDQAAGTLKMTRSAFAQEALRAALEHIATLQREAQHRHGYATHPEKEGEFGKWALEQAWP
jgi:metal-responsive CopG/Arc/MetJ family transcriptional regulator